MVRLPGARNRVGQLIGGKSRRDALRTIGHFAAGGALAVTAPACAKPVQALGEDDVFVQRRLADAQPHIPRRVEPYRLTQIIRIPAGKTLTMDPGTRIIWNGSTGSPTSLVGVFEAGGDDTGIAAQGGEAFVECEHPSPFVYAALMRGHSGFVVNNIIARECSHVHVIAATEDYSRVRLEPPGVNVARNIRITGGGASYSTLQRAGHGACLIYFAMACEVRGARYHNVANGVQWWGGNADPVRPPVQGGSANERKCRNIVIDDVSVENCSGAGIWGAMGSNVIVRNCSVAEIADVGFDAEGSNQVLFEQCTARNARNGCFSTFFLCNGVRFVNCTGIVDNKAFPLVRVYNESQTNWNNKGMEIVGGVFECHDRSGPGTIDTVMGPVGTLVITGATLTNVRIDVAHSNMHHTTIARNTIELPYPLGTFAAISAGSSKSLQEAPTVIAGSVTIEDNVIRYTADPAAGDAAVGIALREDDFNSSAADMVRRNRVIGPFQTGVALTSASSNSGVVPSFTLAANRFDKLAPSARLLTIKRESPPSRQPAVQWDGTQTRNGKAVQLAQALR